MCYSDHIANHIVMLIPNTHYGPAHNAAHTYYELNYGHYELSYCRSTKRSRGRWGAERFGAERSRAERSGQRAVGHIDLPRERDTHKWRAQQQHDSHTHDTTSAYQLLAA